MDIKEIILKSLFGPVDNAEEQELRKWLSQGNNSKLYNSIKRNLSDKSNALDVLENTDVEAAWKLVSEGECGTKNRKHVFGWLGLGRAWCVAAASVIIIIGLGVADYINSNSTAPLKLSDDVIEAMQESVESGKATNIVAENFSSKKVVAAVDTTPITRQQLETYQLDKEDVEMLLNARRIRTINNKESWVELSDGTVAHLNINARIIFPETFPKPTLLNPHPVREVVLEGEAYFMVAHDSNRSFVVHTKNGDIKDYGTEFFVNATLGSTTVALVEGKVSVQSPCYDEVMLKPGQEAVMTDSELSIKTTDVEQYRAWNTGKFSFHEVAIGKILNVVARWYGKRLEIDKGVARDATISGVFYRYASMKETIESLSIVSGLDIQVEDNTIKVYQTN